MLIKATNLVTGLQIAPTNSSLNVLKQWMIGMNAIYPAWNERNYVNDAYLVNPALYAIVNRITAKAATVPFSAYRIKNQSKADKYKSFTGPDATKDSLRLAMELKSEAYELDEKHPINNLLERPNEWQRQSEFIQTCVGFRLLRGERFLYMTILDAGANSGQPTSIVNMPPGCMVVIPGQGLFEISSYELNIGATPLPIPKDLIIFSREWNPVIDANRTHLRGVSPLRAANKLLHRMGAAQDRATLMLETSGAAGILYNKVVDSYTREQRDELKRIMNTEVLGKQNTNSIHVGQGDLGYINFGISATDMELLEQERFTIEQLCNIYKTPSGLFIETNPTDNNVREWKKQMFSDAVIPVLSDMRDDYNEIARRYKDPPYVDFDISGVPEMQEDVNVTATRLDKMWYMTGNQKRLATGQDEDTENEMMNKYFIPSGLKLIDDLDPEKLNREMDIIDQEIDEE